MHAACSRTGSVAHAWAVPTTRTHTYADHLQSFTRVYICYFCRASAPALKGLVWSSLQCDAMRRQALLDCLSTMTRLCKGAVWARSSAFQAIDTAWKLRDKFCPAQHAQLQTVRDFVQGLRATVIKVRTWFDYRSIFKGSLTQSLFSDSR